MRIDNDIRGKPIQFVFALYFIMILHLSILRLYSVVRFRRLILESLYTCLGIEQLKIYNSSSFSLHVFLIHLNLAKESRRFTSQLVAHSG